MATTALVKSDLEIGQKAYDLLRHDEKLGLTSAFWIFDDDAEEWRFVIAAKQYLRGGPKAAYTRVGNALRKARLLNDLPLSRVVVTSPSSPLIAAYLYKPPDEDGPKNRPRRELLGGDRAQPKKRFNATNQLSVRMSSWKALSTPSQVLKTSQNADDFHDIIAPGLGIRLYLRRVEGGADLVGIQYEPVKNHGLVEVAIHVRDDLIEGGISGLTPLELLEAVLERFGLEMVIAGQTSKFFKEATIPITAGLVGKVIEIRNPKDHKFISSQHVKTTRKKGEWPSSVQVKLAFTLDITEYQKWLGSPPVTAK